jgi:hypothetical protein
LADLVDLVARTGELGVAEQHQTLQQLGAALRSVDPEERRGGQDILERFASRADLYADVDRGISALRQVPDQPSRVDPLGGAEKPTPPPVKMAADASLEPTQESEPQPQGHAKQAASDAPAKSAKEVTDQLRLLDEPTVPAERYCLNAGVKSGHDQASTALRGHARVAAAGPPETNAETTTIGIGFARAYAADPSGATKSLLPFETMPTVERVPPFQSFQRLNHRRSDRAETHAKIDAMVESLGLKRADDRRFSRKWILAGASLLVAVVVAVVVVFAMMSGRHGPTLITPSKLSAVLLYIGDVDAIMGKSDMHGDPIDMTPPQNLPGVRPPQCLGALYNVAEPVYRDSGYIDSRNQALRSNTTAAFVNQSAIRFPSPAQASAFVRASADKWKTCSKQPVAVTETNGTTSTWAFMPLVEMGSQIEETETLSQPSDAPGHPVHVCQHVLGAESNVVIEVHTCIDHISEEFESVRIAEKMTAQVTDLTRMA